MKDDDASAGWRGPGGDKKPTINDVARLAGVSKKTVSRVINQSPFVKAQTRERINAIIAETGFAPDPQARALAFRRSLLIGIVFDASEQGVIEMQLGMLEAMRGSGHELVVHACDPGDPGFVTALRRFVEGSKLWGVVLAPAIAGESGVRAVLKDLGCACALVSSDARDVRAAARDAAEQVMSPKTS